MTQDGFPLAAVAILVGPEYQSLNELRTWLPVAEQRDQKCQRRNYY